MGTSIKLSAVIAALSCVTGAGSPNPHDPTEKAQHAVFEGMPCGVTDHSSNIGHVRLVNQLGQVLLLWHQKGVTAAISCQSRSIIAELS